MLWTNGSRGLSRLHRAAAFDALIPVPYRSQWDADAALSRGDCGIVSVAMVANWRGIDITPDALLKRAGLPAGRQTYTFNELIHAASVVGLKLRHVADATWDVIRAEVDAGRPVIPLLRYGELSGNQDTFTGAHFWVVVGHAPGVVIVNDPNFWSARRNEGYQRRVSLVDFERAIGIALNATGNMAWQALMLGA